MDDAYRKIGPLYLALLSPEQVKGERLGDDTMNRWMLGVPPGAAVLDACCGIGNDVLALHRGIPMVGKGGPWTVYGSDLSESLLEVAQTRTSAYGLPADRFRCSSFADLNRIMDWHHRFDIVLAAHAIYTVPEGIDENSYDDYLCDSLLGMKAVLKAGGYLLTNTRDWEALHASGFRSTIVENRHDGETFRCCYEWKPGNSPHSPHAATLAFEREGSHACETSTVRFVGCSVEDLTRLFQAAGFRLAQSSTSGKESDPFFTFMLKA
jgi:SAM-dependent methyltransferase